MLCNIVYSRIGRYVMSVRFFYFLVRNRLVFTVKLVENALRVTDSKERLERVSVLCGIRKKKSQTVRISILFNNCIWLFVLSNVINQSIHFRSNNYCFYYRTQLNRYNKTINSSKRIKFLFLSSRNHYNIYGYLLNKRAFYPLIWKKN